MKETELRKHANCSVCSKGIGHTGMPLFWRVTIERFGVDLRAVRRQDGFATFMGSTKIASIMGPDDEMTMTLMAPVVLTVCEPCALKQTMIAGLAEYAGVPE